jgi:hypothetical protein
MKRPFLTALLFVWLTAAEVGVAEANAASVMVWGTAAYLVLGNLFLGIFEGLVLCHWFRTSAERAIFSMILANYLSAWTGASLLSFDPVQRFDVTIETIQPWFVAAFAAAFLLTLLIEFPFISFVVWNHPRRVRAIAIATITIHVVGYSLVAMWLGLVSSTSLITAFSVVSVKDLDPPADIDVYYLARPAGDLVQINLQRELPTVLANPAAINANDRLFVRPGPDKTFDLWLTRSPHQYAWSKNPGEKLISEFARRAAIEVSIAEVPESKPRNTFWNFGDIPSLVFGTESEYSVISNGALVQSRKNSNRGKSYFALETLLVTWMIRNVTEVNRDLLVLQLGRDQICLLQPSTRRIALLARGWGPVVGTISLP